MKNHAMNFSPEQYIEAALALQKLKINESSKDEVKKQFYLLTDMFETLESEPIPFETESANIYHL